MMRHSEDVSRTCEKMLIETQTRYGNADTLAKLQQTQATNKMRFR